MSKTISLDKNDRMHDIIYTRLMYKLRTFPPFQWELSQAFSQQQEFYCIFINYSVIFIIYNYIYLRLEFTSRFFKKNGEIKKEV